MTCQAPGCSRLATREANGRAGLCGLHYARLRRGGMLETWRNPLVCVCPRPVADPRRDFGMCQLCKRKPLNLMAVTT